MNTTSHAAASVKPPGPQRPEGGHAASNSKPHGRGKPATVQLKNPPDKADYEAGGGLAR